MHTINSVGGASASKFSFRFSNNTYITIYCTIGGRCQFTELFRGRPDRLNIFNTVKPNYNQRQQVCKT